MNDSIGNTDSEDLRSVEQRHLFCGLKLPKSLRILNVCINLSITDMRPSFLILFVFLIIVNFQLTFSTKVAVFSGYKVTISKSAQWLFLDTSDVIAFSDYIVTLHVSKVNNWCQNSLQLVLFEF